MGANISTLFTSSEPANSNVILTNQVLSLCGIGNFLSLFSKITIHISFISFFSPLLTPC